MRYLLIVSVIVFTALPAYACQINDYNQGINSNFNYNSIAYKTVLPFSRLSER